MKEQTSSPNNDLRSFKQLMLSEQLEQPGTQTWVNRTIFILSTIIVLFIIWGSITGINEVSTTPGTIKPLGPRHIIQHLEGGIVENILVENGEKVSSGAPLVRLSPSSALSQLNQLRNREFSLRLDLVRLKYLVDKTPLTYHFLHSLIQPSNYFNTDFYKQQIQDTLTLHHEQEQSQDKERMILAKTLE